MEREAYAGVLRFYELAKKQEWQVKDLPWGEIPPIPEAKGAAQKVARRRAGYRNPPRSWCARKKFSEPAVAIAAEAEISSASAVAATIWAKR